MHTAELLDEALLLAAQLGYRVRQEWMEGCGGLCNVRGDQWLFVDLSQPLAEQLQCVAKVLREDSKSKEMTLSSSIAELLRSEEKPLIDADIC
jgi:hypothetical protein